VKRAGAIIAAIVAACIALSVFRSESHRISTPTAVHETGNTRADLRPPGEPDRPHREMTPDHQPARIQHKDATGLSPLEIVQTSAGPVRIQRTFGLDGRLLKEEAFLDGKLVPVPRSPR
jgi:hypothetical protein